ncbi:MAG TPA: alpha/beta fold hydrolase [Pseudomonadales bacterium]|nr:alpha/beta fold hydrolase [Pseudomonadales bacterium]
MPEFIKYLVIFTASLLFAGCASVAPKEAPALVQQANYSEETLINHQGLRLFVRTWQPEGPAKANILILHGTALHGGVYASVANKLNAAGIRVMALDMQGWGRSEGKGGHGYVESFDDYAKDTYYVLNLLRIRYPGTPNYLMGESLGGAVAVYSVLKNDLWFDGVITSAVGYKPRPALLGIRTPGFLNSVAMTTAKWWGHGVPKAPVLESDIGIRMVVERDDLQRSLLDDPYVSHDWLPAAYVSTLVDASEYIDKNLQNFKMPILLLHGNHDMLVPPESSQEIFDRVASTTKEIHFYDSPHAVLLEKANDEAAKAIVDFVDHARRTVVAAHNEN